MVRPLLRTDRCRPRPVPPREQGHVTLKKAETIADQIVQTIVSQRWEPGELFGSEVELIARYGVSRAVFREAVRLLEHHGLVEMRRGLHGGLFIRQPDPTPVALTADGGVRVAPVVKTAPHPPTGLDAFRDRK